MTWWGWMIIGAVLLGAELFAIDAQFYLVFLGVSAALVGTASLLGIAMPEWVQWLAFGLLALVFFFTFRKSLYTKLNRGVKGFRENVTGDTINLVSDLAPGQDARVEYRGTNWTVRNISNTTITGGSRAVVIKSDGLTLHVKPQ